MIVEASWFWKHPQKYLEISWKESWKHPETIGGNNQKEFWKYLGRIRQAPCNDSESILDDLYENPTENSFFNAEGSL